MCCRQMQLWSPQKGQGLGRPERRPVVKGSSSVLSSLQPFSESTNQVHFAVHCSRHAIGAALVLKVKAGSMLNHEQIGLDAMQHKQGVNPTRCKCLSSRVNCRAVMQTAVLSQCTHQTALPVNSTEPIRVQSLHCSDNVQQHAIPKTGCHSRAPVETAAKQFVMKPYLINARQS